MNWQPIDTAPKDGTRVDLWAKCWRSERDDFTYQRCADCYWTNGDSMTNRVSRWVNLQDGWHATHWMELPGPPVVQEEAKQEGVKEKNEEDHARRGTPKAIR